MTNLIALINITPNPIAFSIGPIEVHWYGLAYVAAILAAGWIVTVEARRRDLDTNVIADGIIVIAVAALIGGRLYHVIDQWAYYKDHLAQIVLPPYSGLGIYGGLATGLIAVLWIVRRHQLSFWRWADILAPCILLAQAIGRWGNFMNQELYGPPTNLPWGIAIQCQYRVAEYACPPGSSPTATLGQHFVPLFFYESMLSLLGVAVMLFLWRRFTARGRFLLAGDVGLLYFVWYGLERTVLETLRGGWNWTFFGIATAQLVGIGVAAAAVVVLVVRRRSPGLRPEPPAATGANPTVPAESAAAS